MNIGKSNSVFGNEGVSVIYLCEELLGRHGKKIIGYRQLRKISAQHQNSESRRREICLAGTCEPCPQAPVV